MRRAVRIPRMTLAAGGVCPVVTALAARIRITRVINEPASATCVAR